MRREAIAAIIILMAVAAVAALALRTGTANPQAPLPPGSLNPLPSPEDQAQSVVAHEMDQSQSRNNAPDLESLLIGTS